MQAVKQVFSKKPYNLVCWAPSLMEALDASDDEEVPQTGSQALSGVSEEAKMDGSEDEDEFAQYVHRWM